MSSKNFMSYEDATTVLGAYAEAIKNKQGTITAGTYIHKSGDTISVKRDISYEADEVFFAEQTNDGLHVVVTVGSTTLYEENFVMSDPNHTVLDLVQISFNVRSVRWIIKYLKASKTQSAGYETIVWPSVTDTFVTTVDADKKLIIQSELDTALSGKQDTLTFDDVPTANSNNPVKSGGVKSAIDSAVSRCYHHAGTKTVAQLTHDLLIAANEGNVYEMTDSGTTTSDFMEGIGRPIKEGDNVGIARVSEGVYKFDLLSGFVDTTNFVQKSQTAGLLKNDGTVNTTIEGDISSLKSGLTTLDNEVNGDATTYPYADVITIEDAVPANVADCTVKIEPVQDLHGYDHPWPGGAGKNKLPLTVDGIKAASGGTWTGNKKTLNSIEIEILTDESNNVTGISAKGTASLETFFTIAELTMGSDEYILNGCPAGGGWGTYFIYWHGTSDPKDMGNGVTINDPNVAGNVQIHISSGYAIDTVFYPMIRLATETDATFAPYTNICPITGHTEASVQMDGKNLFDYSTCENKSIDDSGNTASDSTRLLSGYISTANAANIITIPSGITLVGFVYYDGTKTFVSRNIVNKTGTFGFTATQPYVKLYLSKTDGSAAISKNDVVGMQFERGSVATGYVPYVSPHTATITFGQTVYGGTVDFDSGVMTVTHAIVTFDGTESGWVTINSGKAVRIKVSGMKRDTGGVLPDDIANYAEIIAIDYVFNHIRDYTFSISADNYFTLALSSDITDVNDYKTYLSNNPLQICYELATPITIQLTPQQIQLLKGQNTLTASTGQISVTVNGVSGSIGAVQEQVNDIAEDVVDVQSSLINKAGYNLTAIAANATSFTFADLATSYIGIMCLSLPSVANTAKCGLYVLVRQGTSVSVTNIYESASLGVTATISDGDVVIEWTTNNPFGGAISILQMM